MLLGLTFNALLYGLVHAMLRRWLMRDGRWDGRGPLFNLLVAAGLLPNILSALFESLELPPDLAQLSGVAVALWGLWTVSRACRGSFQRPTRALPWPAWRCRRCSPCRCWPCWPWGCCGLRTGRASAGIGTGRTRCVGSLGITPRAGRPGCGCLCNVSGRSCCGRLCNISGCRQFCCVAGCRPARPFCSPPAGHGRSAWYPGRQPDGTGRAGRPDGQSDRQSDRQSNGCPDRPDQCPVRSNRQDRRPARGQRPGCTEGQ